MLADWHLGMISWTGKKGEIQRGAEAVSGKGKREAERGRGKRKRKRKRK